MNFKSRAGCQCSKSRGPGHSITEAAAGSPDSILGLPWLPCPPQGYTLGAQVLQEPGGPADTSPCHMLVLFRIPGRNSLNVPTPTERALELCPHGDPPPDPPGLLGPAALVDGHMVLVPGPSPPPRVPTAPAVVQGGAHTPHTEGHLSLGCFCVSFAGVGLEAEAQELHRVRALKQELCQPHRKPPLMARRVSRASVRLPHSGRCLLPQPPESPWGPCPQLPPSPQQRTDPNLPACPLLGRPVGFPAQVWLSRLGGDGGYREECPKGPPRPRRVWAEPASGWVPALLLSCPTPPRKLVVAQPQPRRGQERLEGSVHFPSPTHPKPRS